jgi:hypothetical protein
MNIQVLTESRGLYQQSSLLPFSPISTTGTLSAAANGLTSWFAKFRRGILAVAEAVYLAIRIDCGPATWLRRALYLPFIVGGAKAHTALHDTISIPHRATAGLGTEHRSVLIRRALSFSAHHVSMLVLDAIPGTDFGADQCSQSRQAIDY